MKSVFITGASGAGKSTAFRSLAEHGFTPAPNHLTRPARANETEGFDAHFISVEQFAANLALGMYFEKTMEEAEYAGVHYGSPVTWETNPNGESSPFIAIPANVVVLSALCERLEKQGRRSEILWANLHAPVETRHDRVSSYIDDPEQLHRRLYTGVSQGTRPNADLNLDTSTLSKSEVVDKILENVN